MHRSNTHTRKVALQTLALGVPLGKIAVDGAGRWCPVGGGAKAKGDGRSWSSAVRRTDMGPTAEMFRRHACT
jgi:hypothetical protein